MNTSTNTNQTHDTTTSTMRADGIGFLRRYVASALLAMAFASTGIGLAATSYADEGAPPPDPASPAHRAQQRNLPGATRHRAAR